MTRGRIVDVDVDSASPVEVPAGEFWYLVARRAGRVVDRRVVEGPARVAADSFSSGEEVPSPTLPADRVSIVIATRDRPEDLARCLSILRERASGALEIVVCDSASADGPAIERIVHGGAENVGRALPGRGTTEIAGGQPLAESGGAGFAAGLDGHKSSAVNDLRSLGGNGTHNLRPTMKYVRAGRPGLSLARNEGVAIARGEVVAFLDDDCAVEPGWLDGIRGGFEDDRVGAVTGSYLPAELDHEAQVMFLRYAHMDRRGFRSHRFSRDVAESRHWPLDAWRMGSGGNLAVRADTLRRLGGFRLDLGLGTPALGGEDLFLLWSVIRSGVDVVYRPGAMVSHRHHRDVASLHRVLLGYGIGHQAYLAAARAAGASASAVGVYWASVLYDRAKRAGAALVALDQERLALVAAETRGLVSRSGLS